MSGFLAETVGDETWESLLGDAAWMERDRHPPSDAFARGFAQGALEVLEEIDDRV